MERGSTDVPFEVSQLYETYMGRWSRLVATHFLDWMSAGDGRAWLDVGCGTGALTESILARCKPLEVLGVDPSQGFIADARRRLGDHRVRFEVGDAMALPVETDAFDLVVSGLALNFVPDPGQAAAELVRAARPGGTVGLYVWDYGGGMELIKRFWDAAITLNADAVDADEVRFASLCAPEPLISLFIAAGLADVTVKQLEVTTRFVDFDDYWRPFTGGQGPAPAYAMALPEAARVKLRERLHATVQIASDGSIDLIARAWAVRGARH